eukprot:g1259.t1
MNAAANVPASGGAMMPGIGSFMPGVGGFMPGMAGTMPGMVGSMPGMMDGRAGFSSTMPSMTGAAGAQLPMGTYGTGMPYATMGLAQGEASVGRPVPVVTAAGGAPNGNVRRSMTAAGQPFGSSLAADAILGSMARATGPSVDSLVDDVYLQLSGESADIARKWRQLQIDATELQKKKETLRREWAKVRQARSWLEDEKQRFREVSLSSEAPSQPERRVRLNVGGQIYETTETILTMDPDSMLAALCRDDSPLNHMGADDAADNEEKEQRGEGGGDDGEKEEEEKAEVPSGKQGAAAGKSATLTGTTMGTVFIERDGSLFRHILNFLREGFLPRSKPVLRSLYREAKYFELRSLKQEIEQRLGLVALLDPRPSASSSRHEVETGLEGVDFRDPFMQPGARKGEANWWERPPAYKGWWPSQKRGTANMNWWTGDVYRGRNLNSSLASLSRNPAAAVNAANPRYSYMAGKAARSYKGTKTTWDPVGRGDPQGGAWQGLGLGYSGLGASGYAGLGVSQSANFMGASNAAYPHARSHPGGATRFR